MGRVGACGVDDRAEAHRIGKQRIWVTSEKGNPIAAVSEAGTRYPYLPRDRRARHVRASPRRKGEGAHRVRGTVVHQAQRGRTLADSKRWDLNEIIPPFLRNACGLPVATGVRS